MVNFENLALKSLLDGDLSLLSQIKVDYFTKGNVKIYEKLLEFFSQHNRLPTYNEITSLIQAKAPANVVPQFVALIQSIQNITDQTIDTNLVAQELKEAFTIRTVDREIVELVEANKIKDTKEVKRLLNLLSEKINLSGVKVVNLEDVKDEDDTHTLVRTFLDRESESEFFGGGHTGLTIYSAESGGGKALQNGTLIPTPNGHKKIEELKVNDLVFGRDGKPTKVLGVYPQGLRPTYKVEFIDGRVSYADAEHIWTVIDSNNKEKDLTTVELIEKGLSTTRYDSRYDTVQNKYKYSVPLCKAVEYPTKSLVIPPYVLGAILGDGGTSSGWITYTSADDELIEFITNDIGSDAVVTDRAAKYSFGITKCPSYLQYLKENNLMCLSNDKFIPTDYLEASITDRELLLQGLLDTDGSVSESRPSKIEFTTVSKQLAVAISTLVNSLGGVATTSVKTNSGYKDSTGTFIKCQDTYRVLIRFSKDSTIRPFRLSRKASIYKPTTKLSKLSIKNITYIAETECTCIKVEAQDSLFLTQDYIVTHNTIALGQTALNNFKDGKNVMFISLELSRKVMYNRLISAESNVDFSIINEGAQNKEQQEAMDKAHAKLFGKGNPNKFFIIDDDITDTELINLISVESQINKIDVFVIDYLQLVEPDSSGDEWKSLTKLCKKLHKLTKAFDIAIISASQVNEEGTEKGSIMPKISARGSKEVKFSSSQFVHFAKDRETGMLNMFQMKNRIGKTKHLILEPEFEHMKINSTGVELNV